MKKYKLLILSIGMLWLISCDNRLEQDLSDAHIGVAVNENVKYEGNILTVKKGTPVEFLLQGNPDYITFFSGEIGHQYIYRDRKEYSAEDIVSSELKFSVWTQYGESIAYEDLFDVLYLAEERNDETNEIVTPAFPGMSKTDFEADSLLVEKQTSWKTLVERAKLPNKPVSAANAYPYTIPIKQYIDKKLTLAIAYNKDKKEIKKENTETGKPETIVQPTVNFQGMRIETTWKNGRTTTSYASAFGLTPLNMKNKTKFKDQSEYSMPKDLEYGSVTEGVAGMWNLVNIGTGGFTIRGAAKTFNWKYSWLVSDYLNLQECPEPDKGVWVKEMSQNPDSYTYTYNQVGTYTATFLMNNVNYDYADTKTQEIIVNVIE